MLGKVRGSRKILGTFLLTLFIASVFLGYQIGSSLIERADSTITVEPSSFVDDASYVVFKDGSTIYAKNGKSGEIDYSGTVASTVIQNAIDALTNGGKIFIKAGTYSIGTQITIKDDIIFCGEGSKTILQASGDNKVLRPYNYDNIVIKDLVVDGTGQTSGSGMGIYASCDNLLIQNVEVRNTYGHGIYCSGKGNIIIEKCKVHDISSNTVTASGIVCTDATHIIIRDNMLWNVEGINCGSIFVHSNAPTATDVWASIQNNIIWDSYWFGIGVGDVNKVVISGNQIHTVDVHHAIGVDPDSPWIDQITITENFCENANEIGILVDAGTANAIVSDNVCIGNGQYGIKIRGSHDVTVTGNICANNGQIGSGYAGIGLEATPTLPANDIVVVGNRCFDDQDTKTQDYGIREVDAGAGADYNLIAYNDVRGNDVAGILTVGPNTVVYGNLS